LQTGPESSGGNYLLIGEIEFYGRVATAQIAASLDIPPASSASSVSYVASQSTVYQNVPSFTASFSVLTDGNNTTGAATEASALAFGKATFSSAVTVSSITVAAGDMPGWGSTSPYLNGTVLQWSTDDASWTTVANVSGVADFGANVQKI
jgi:hypothetical protein